MNQKQRKTFKKQNKDKILIGKGALRNLNMQPSTQASEKSKKIKKYKGKNIITEDQVRQKLKTRRLVVPSSKLK